MSLAQRLKTLGWDVVVIERAHGPRTQGYMIDFFGPGYDAAEAMGTLPRLHELAYAIEEASFVDDRGRRRASLSYARFQKAVHGRLLSIMRPDLELALREAVMDDVDLRFGCDIAGIERAANGARLTLADGTRLDADLLVGADGIHSTVRRMVFGPEALFFRYVGFHTAAYVIDDPDIYRQVKNRFCLTDTAGRQMGFYGLRDGRVAVFAVHRTADPALPADARQAVRRAYATLGWVATRALATCPDPPDVYYDQVAQIEIAQWHRGRVVLLGDACQAVSLLAGQGASLAVAGVYVLAEQLAGAATVDAALARYQELWQPVVAEKQRVGRRGARWFLPPSSFQLWLRRAMLGMMNLPGLDTFVGAALVGKSNATIQELSGGRSIPNSDGPFSVACGGPPGSAGVPPAPSKPNT